MTHLVDHIADLDKLLTAICLIRIKYKNKQIKIEKSVAKKKHKLITESFKLSLVLN